MNLLFITLIDLSNINDRGIYHDLLRKFRDEGHSVYVIHPSERRKRIPTKVETQAGIHFLRVCTLNLQKTNVIEKGVGTILLEQQFLKAFNKFFLNVKFDLILYSTPPVTLTKVIKYIQQKDRAFSYLLLKDIFPQNAVDLGMIKKDGFLHRYFMRKEKQLYTNSDFIGCMSSANVDFIIKHNPQLNPNKIEVNPNSIAPVSNRLSPFEKNRIREHYHIPVDKIVFIYGGNLGKPQGVDFLIEVLQSQLANPDIYFIIVGDGTEFSTIKKWFDNRKPGNVILLNSLPKSEYDQLLKSADVGLIFLDKRFTIPNFPSRLLSYLENRMPVLAATDKSTDLGKIIEASACGYWCESGDLTKFNQLISKFILNRNNIAAMGQKSYELLLQDYTVDISYNKIMEKIVKQV